jgi:RTX calcium-binding nonapeptide repeat (4 copies)
MLRRLIALLALTGASLAASALGGAAAADAAVSCKLINDLVYIEMSADNDLTLVRPEGANVGLYSDPFASNAVTCSGGTPTLANTETIAIVDMSDDTQRPGQFDGDTIVHVHEPDQLGPGKTQENGNDAFSEIEFAINLGVGETDGIQISDKNASTDTIRMGPGGVDWNAGSGDPAPDADLALASDFDQYTFELGDGAGNLFTAQGGPGVGGPYTGPSKVRVFGGDAGNTMEGSDNPAGDLLSGGAGPDTIRGFAGKDEIFSDLGDDVIDGGTDTDLANYGTVDGPVTVDLGRTCPQPTAWGTRR